jgi:hypothetical protein
MWWRRGGQGGGGRGLAMVIKESLWRVTMGGRGGGGGLLVVVLRCEGVHEMEASNGSIGSINLSFLIS